jgi:outer membrane protein OmpA-like peptidoglycan-associated protein
MTTEVSIDTDGDTYEFRTYYNDWKERQKAMVCDIPLSFLFQKKMGNKFSILTSIGAKASIPVDFSSKSIGGEIKTTGYYKQWNVELYGMPQHNFKNIKEEKRAAIPSKLYLSTFVDLGATYRISKKMFIYGGLYVNYGVTDIVANKGKSIYEQNGTYNGVLVSDFASKTTTEAYGIKLGIRVWLGPRNAELALDRQASTTISNAIDTTKKESKGLQKDSVTDSVQGRNLIAQMKQDSLKKSEQKTTASTLKQNVTPNKKILYAPVILDDSDKKQELSDSSYMLLNINDIDNMTEDEVYYIARLLASKIKPKFAFASDEPLNPQDDIYKVLAEILKRRSDINLLIIGHTCDIGSKDANIRMGMKRAAKIQQLFEGLGVKVIQLPTISKFYSEPLVPNTSEENRAKNRRVEIFIE